MFMPHRVAAFLQGINVNIMCYGQTGSGKTHTMFGPPGLMAKAATGAFGDSVSPDYGVRMQWCVGQSSEDTVMCMATQ